MAYAVVFLAVAVALFLLLSLPGDRSGKARGWMKTGGILGVVILFVRLTRIPLATLLSVIPFIMPYFRRAQSRQEQARVAMSREEAALILGVAADANEEEVKNAHRRLISRNHPDAGGSDYLAAQINRARDILLSK